ncbi:Glycosyltransferase like family 2 [Singulisphaera sp. GP187]|uniref:glycosyltransferase n=1 Tax=Singulisphaera sp. GP187 TaxID=1882752 RepID=UPI000927B2EB|nr:glycosyltransferase [Singulisphaera sp. GP187]SIN68768.1 Glycosyltransferase like family 2 [Singulisphaera sp. GP187]
MLTVPRGQGTTSVIVPCLRGWRAARRCLVPLLRHTDASTQLVLVTNTRSGTLAAYLAGIRDAEPARVQVVVVRDLKRVRDAWRCGLREARREFVALLGPTTIVTDGWHDQLTALANADPTIGMVAPMSNVAPPLQAADGAPAAENVDAFAARWRAARLGRWLTSETLGGPCLLLKRGILEAISAGSALRSADLRSDRLSARIRQAGFQLAIANDLYVHRFQRSSPSTPSTGLAGFVRPCRVSLTMIVRNEEANLPACLTSAAGLFDEIVIVDTGSTDRTIEIARSFGARVFEFPWVDDFAAARNAALARATGDYAFWLDADDRIESPHRERLRTLFDGLRSKDAAFVIRCACDADPSGGGATVVDHVRLFPLREDVRWTYRVHEQILPALRQAKIHVDWTDAVIRHVGYNDPELRQSKLQRDDAILRLELAEHPDDPFVLFNLGQISLESGDPITAVGYLQRSLVGSAPGDSITCKLHALMARAYQQAGDLDSALAACDVGLATLPDDAELLFRKGVAHRLRGEPERAGLCWRRILTLQRPERFASVDQGIFGHVTQQNLAMLCEEQGDRAAAALHWSAVLAERPDDARARQALGRLGQPLVHAGEWPS